MSDTIWRRRDHWVGCDVEDSFVMIDTDAGQYLALNATAAAAWQALETGKTKEDLAAILRERFDVSADTCSAAVTVLLDKMKELGLVDAG